jgi:hypothetical protein
MRTAITIAMKTPVFPSLMSPAKGRKFFLSIRLFFLILAFPVTITLFFIAYLFDQKEKNKFSFKLGLGNEKEEIESILNWNTCMLYGGLPIALCGTSAAYQRKEVISNKINAMKKDLVLLQGVSEDAAEWLYERLKNNYKYFYFNIIKDPLFALNSGLFIASKVRFEDFQAYELPTNGVIKKAYAIAKSKNLTICLTELEEGEESLDQSMRENQIDIILNSLSQEIERSNVYIAGNLHMSREAFKRTKFANSFSDNYSIKKLGETATTYFLSLVRDVEAKNFSDDYILMNKKQKLPIERSDGFKFPTTVQDSSWLNSNHHPLFVDLQIKSKDDAK